MFKILSVVFLCVLLVGCAQAMKDYQTGSSTPLVNGEVSPSQQSSVISNTVAALPFPFAGPISLALGFLGTIFFTWQRGVGIRKAGGAPVAKTVSNSTATNGILQDVANIFSGMFTAASTTSPTIVGTVWQRIWKTALVTVAAGATTAATVPSVATFLTGHPVIDGIFVALSSGLAGLEKGLSTVPVVASSTVVV